MNCLRAFLLLSATMGVFSCKKTTPPTPPPITVTVTPIVEQDVTERGTWVGLLNGYLNADIRAQVTGYLMTQNYKEGSLVKKGAVLFTIDKRPFEAALAQAQATYSQSQAKAELANVTLSRQTQLYQTKVISQQEYDTSALTARADIAAAAAAQANAQAAQINLDYCTIVAPLDGIAGDAQAQIGDLVGPGGSSTVLTQMSQVNPIKVVFSITEQEYLKAAPLLKELSEKPVQDLPAGLKLTLANGEVYQHNGHFDFVNRQINTATGTIQITGIFPNDEDTLRPGLFARVSAPVRQLKNALVVPQAATVELQGNYLVSIVEGETVKTVPVKLGPIDGQLQVIEGQVKAGDNVVVGGVEKVRPNMKVITKPYVPPAAPKPAGSPEASPTATPEAAEADAK